MISSVLILAAIAGNAPTTDACKGTSTVEMAQCMDGKIAKATARLNEYVGRAENRFAEDAATSTAIADASIAFDAYRQTYCGAVYTKWRDGTIRYTMSQSCQLRLIDEQTHHVWQDFLTYVDSTPPILPEPKPTK